MSMQDQDQQDFEPQSFEGQSHGDWVWDEKQCQWVCRPGGGRPPGPGPGPCPPGPGPGPDRPLNGPIVGVTDGSVARPGMVGEFLLRDVTIQVVQPQLTYPVSALVLPPGDWNVWGWCGADIQFRGLDFYISPAPVGFTGGLTGHAVLVAPGLFDRQHYVHSEIAFAQVAVPTLVPFILTLTDPVWGSGTSTIAFRTMARRMR